MKLFRADPEHVTVGQGSRRAEGGARLTQRRQVSWNHLYFFLGRSKEASCAYSKYFKTTTVKCKQERAALGPNEHLPVLTLKWPCLE
ncbi:hypothetical protein AGOR_G00197180 [Albula goreensis]|uniref:Uncharacterized protein n=1 Tax=Albula goreensis TaxID=1534307 RepID=A0A8T3CRJ9_9TELE|nr:hypothetical protein AGOR_G00197180 [Albula goreensis]